VLEATHADMTDVADRASGTARRPWGALEQALLARGARSVVVSDRADVVGVRFAIDEGQVRLEVPADGNHGEAPWSEVEDLLVAKLELVRSGRSTFAAEFPDGTGRPRRRGLLALALAAVVISLCALVVFGHLPASVVGLVTAPLAFPHRAAPAEQATRYAR
jgi:hypothetical protein